MTDTLETLRRLAPRAIVLAADLPYDVQLIDNTIDEAGRVQREMIAAIDPVLEMLAEALAALEPLARMAESYSEARCGAKYPDDNIIDYWYDHNSKQEIFLRVGDARRAAEVLEKVQ